MIAERSQFIGTNGYAARIDCDPDVCRVAVVKSATGKAHSGSVRLLVCDAVTVAEWLLAPAAIGDRLEVAGVNGYTLRIEATAADTVKVVTLRSATRHTSGIAKLDRDATTALVEWAVKYIGGGAA